MAVSPLAALIEQAQDDFLRETGVELTQGSIAKRSGLSRQRISQLVTERPKTLLPPETIEALAKGLRLGYDLVLVRALESSGYDVSGLTPYTKPEQFALAARRGKAKKTLGRDEQPL